MVSTANPQIAHLMMTLPIQKGFYRKNSPRTIKMTDLPAKRERKLRVPASSFDTSG
jgi:hypothetical protein